MTTPAVPQAAATRITTRRACVNGAAVPPGSLNVPLPRPSA